jgi:hypothetical protein
LLVKAFYVGNGSDGSPVAGANVSIVDLGRSIPVQAPLKTNASGELELNLSPAQYRVTISNLQFQNATLAQVYSNKTTELDTTVSRQSYSVLFSEVSDDESSGFNGPWAPIFVAIRPSAAIFQPSHLIFLETEYPGKVVRYTDYVFVIYASSVVSSETPARLITSDLRPSSSLSGGVLWLTLQPLGFVPLATLLKIELATYSATVQVTIYGS